MSVSLDLEKLKQIMPNAREADLEFYLDALKTQLDTFQIDTKLRFCHFIAQIAHESGSFRYRVENLNYSAKALRAVFGKYFPTDEMAEQYARKPEQIANIVYADRMGNGDTESGDGWRYRGRGLIQLTGRDNYTACGKSIGKDLVDTPDLLATEADAAVDAAGWFWDSRNLNEYADKDDIRTITKRINGGYNGLEDREAFLARAKAVYGLT